MNMNAILQMNKQFNQSSNTSITKSDIDDYKNRVGKPSPTAMDAMHFWNVEHEITKSLNKKEMEKFNNLILPYRKNKSSNIKRIN